jgi:chaperonin GroEL (HSP60 family)
MMMMADWLVFLCLLKPDPLTATNVDLQDVKIVKQVGGTMDDTELVRGLVLERGVRTYILLHTYIHF